MKAIAKRFNKPQQPPYFDESELKTNLGQGNFIFVGSSNDLFCNNYPIKWIKDTLDHCDKFNNSYLFQSKNPNGFVDLLSHPVVKKSVLCTTLETDYWYNIKAPTPNSRSEAMSKISAQGVNTYVTIEPIMDFHLEHFVTMIKRCNPIQVNIGADTGNNHLPEPPKENILALIAELEKFTIVKQKSNLKRLLK
jgi:hypothetical protein